MSTHIARASIDPLREINVYSGEEDPRTVEYVATDGSTRHGLDVGIGSIYIQTSSTHIGAVTDLRCLIQFKIGPNTEDWAFLVPTIVTEAGADNDPRG